MSLTAYGRQANANATKSLNRALDTRGNAVSLFAPGFQISKSPSRCHGILLLGFYGSQACYYSCNLLLESACRGLALQHASDNDSLSHTHSARSDGGLALRARSARSRCLCLAHTYKLHVLQRLQKLPRFPATCPPRTRRGCKHYRGALRPQLPTTGEPPWDWT